MAMEAEGGLLPPTESFRKEVAPNTSCQDCQVSKASLLQEPPWPGN